MLSEGGWNKKVSLQNSKHLRAQHQNWTWASKRGRPSRSASEWVFSSSISHVNNLWYNRFVDLLMSDYRIAWWEMQVIKQAFPKLINLLQNIKKKEAGSAKTRPAAGGLLPPPPGAKAGGLIPPPGGQQSFPPVQTNNGEHQSLCQTPVSLCVIIYKMVFIFSHLHNLSWSSPSFRLRVPCSCSPAQFWCVGGFYICRLQVGFLIPSCPSVFIIVFEFYISSPSSLSFSPPSSAAPVKMLPNQDGCSLVELWCHPAHTQVPYIPWLGPSRLEENWGRNWSQALVTHYCPLLWRFPQHRP